MALTYEDSAALMRDSVFVSRVKVACLTYAAYILGEATDVAAHNTRVRWAQQTMQTPDTVAQNIAPAVVMDPSVQVEGGEIDDAGLQAATETAVNKLL